MKTDENILTEHLKQTDPEFRRLMEEHLRYEQRLEEFNNLRYLTSEQEIRLRRHVGI